MILIDTTFSILTFLWFKKKWRFGFFVAPKDSIVVVLKSKHDLDAVYFREFKGRVLFSDVYTSEVSWTYTSDTIEPLLVEVEQASFFKRNEVHLRIMRFPKDSNYYDFNTTLRFVKKNVPYTDTVWDTVLVYLDEWRFILPPSSSSVYGTVFGRDPYVEFDYPVAGFILWLAPRALDDSVILRYGRDFLAWSTKRPKVCSHARAGQVVVYILDSLNYRRALSGLDYIPYFGVKNVNHGCFSMDTLMYGGSLGIVLENTSFEILDFVVRLAVKKLIPRPVIRYKVVEEVEFDS